MVFGGAGSDAEFDLTFEIRLRLKTVMVAFRSRESSVERASFTRARGGLRHLASIPNPNPKQLMENRDEHRPHSTFSQLGQSCRRGS